MLIIVPTGIKVKTINDESFHYEFEHDTKICDIKTKLKVSDALSRWLSKLTMYCRSQLRSQKTDSDSSIKAEFYRTRA